MAFIYKEGFQLKEADTLASGTSVFVDSGLVLDATTAKWKEFSDAVLLKHVGLNYIYINAVGEIYNSAIETSDSIVLTVHFGASFEIISAFNPDTNIDYDQIIENLTSALLELQDQIDDILASGYEDTISEVINETLIISGNIITASFSVDAVIDMYVIGLGELEHTSINNINGNNIELTDTSLNGKSLNVSYNTTKTK